MYICRIAVPVIPITNLTFYLGFSFNFMFMIWCLAGGILRFVIDYHYIAFHNLLISLFLAAKAAQ